jgi:hypothetical protein
LGVLFFYLFDFLLNLSKIIGVFISNVFFVSVVHSCMLMSYHALCVYRDLKDIRCIVFVERVVTAVVLHYLLKSYFRNTTAGSLNTLQAIALAYNPRQGKSITKLWKNFVKAWYVLFTPLSFTCKNVFCH